MKAHKPEDAHPLLRKRDGHHARITFEELFFDLIYAFAITQLSHNILHNLSIIGVIETLVLWFAVWLGWQYTCWVTNWFEPETFKIRSVLFATTGIGLIMTAAIPFAFESNGWIFAAAYMVMQLGRTGYIVYELGQNQQLTSNYRRMFGWLLISATFWIAGAFVADGTRILLWTLAVLCEYTSPMFGFRLPFMGRSHTSDWTIEGGHLTERCQLFVIVALGETLLATGGTLSQAEQWNVEVISAMLATFIATLSIWWLYFGTSGKEATYAITHSTDPGKMGAYYHYIHVVLIAGIIVSAVGNDLVLDHPNTELTVKYCIVLISGPAIFLLGSAIYKKAVYSILPITHICGVIALIILTFISSVVTMLIMGWITSVVMLSVAVCENCVHRNKASLR
jgi:low temperature requirement protein LtrA